MHEQLLSPGRVDVAARYLLAGGIVAFPTDTVYGLAAHPDHPEAVARLFVAKRRPPEKAIPILLADALDLDRVADAPSAAAVQLANAFWPGALTLVVPRRRTRSDDLPTVAVRVPALELARTLIRAAGGALAVTSANISGGPNTTTADEVVAQLDGRIEAVVDGGRCPGGIESTVIDTTQSPMKVLRRGALDVEAIRAIVNVAH
jgi:L-threonylcarbamoyladenylate synthase